MKITFNAAGVLIESPLGNISGDTLLHYRIAKMFWENAEEYSENPATKNTDRILVLTLVEEQDV